jgi:hypothetical protein
LHHLLDGYRTIAKTLVPAGESAAPVICVTDGKQQDRVGGMLATADEDARCGYNGSQLIALLNTVELQCEPTLVRVENGGSENSSHYKRRIVLS